MTTKQPNPVPPKALEDPFVNGYHHLIDQLSYSPGRILSDIKVIPDDFDDDDDWPSLTKEQLATQVFPGKQVTFEYQYAQAEQFETEEPLSGTTFRVTTGTTLKEVLMPLVVWGFSFKTDACMFFEGFSKASQDGPWECSWGS
jgi:hypothetical protein